MVSIRAIWGKGEEHTADENAWCLHIFVLHVFMFFVTKNWQVLRLCTR